VDPVPQSKEQVPLLRRRIEPALFVGIVLLTLALAALISVRPWRKSRVAWGKDLASALADAHAAKQLVFVEVYADWCDPCRQMEHETFTDGRVGEELAALHPVRLNDDLGEVQNRMAEWKSFALPTHVLLNPDGTLHAKSMGYMPPGEFAAWLRAAKQ